MRKITLIPLVLLLSFIIVDILMFLHFPKADDWASVSLLVNVVVGVVAIYAIRPVTYAKIAQWYQGKEGTDDFYCSVREMIQGAVKSNDRQNVEEVLQLGLSYKVPQENELLDEWVNSIQVQWNPLLAQGILELFFSPYYNNLGPYTRHYAICLLVLAAIKSINIGGNCEDTRRGVRAIIYDPMARRLISAKDWTERHTNIYSQLGEALWKLGPFDTEISRSVDCSIFLSELQASFIALTHDIWCHFNTIGNDSAANKFYEEFNNLLSSPQLKDNQALLDILHLFRP